MFAPRMLRKRNRPIDSTSDPQSAESEGARLTNKRMNSGQPLCIAQILPKLTPVHSGCDAYGEAVRNGML